MELINMVKPKRFGTHKCPHGKMVARASDVTGRFCKNSCEIYKARGCKRFNKK